MVILIILAAPQCEAAYVSVRNQANVALAEPRTSNVQLKEVFEGL